MTLADIEEYILRSIATLGCNIYSQITVANVTLPKAVLNTVKVFAVYKLLLHDHTLIIIMNTSVPLTGVNFVRRIWNVSSQDNLIMPITETPMNLLCTYQVLGFTIIYF